MFTVRLFLFSMSVTKVTKNDKLSSVNCTTYDFPSGVRVCSNHSYVTKYIPPTGASKVLMQHKVILCGFLQDKISANFMRKVLLVK